MPPFIYIPFILFIGLGFAALFAFRRLDSQIYRLSERLGSAERDLSYHRTDSEVKAGRTASDLSVLSHKVSDAWTRLQELVQWRHTAELDFRKATTLMARVAELEHRENQYRDADAHRRIDGLLSERGTVRQRLDELERRKKAPQTATQVSADLDRLRLLEIRVSALEASRRRPSSTDPGSSYVGVGVFPPGAGGLEPSLAALSGSANATMTPP